MSLAQLKRDAASGKIKFEMIERYGETGDKIPKRCRGIREVVKVNSVAILLKTPGGLESELRYGCSNLLDYDGETLTIYAPGKRELNEQEKSIFAEWERVKQEYLKKYPYDDIYYKMKNFFEKENPDYAYLTGWNAHKGKRYEYNGKVFDNSIKGEAILKCIIHW